MRKNNMNAESNMERWEKKIKSARIDMSEGARLFKVMAFISVLGGIPLAFLFDATYIFIAGIIVGFLFLGISYILQAQEIIVFKLYDSGSEIEGENDEQS